MIRCLILLLSLSLTVSCRWREEQAAKILEKTNVRDDLFDALIQDSTYLSEFIAEAVKDKQAQNLFKQNDSLVKILCTSSTVDSLIHHDVEVNRLLAIKLVHRMEEDTASCQLMCGMVMENPVLKRHLKASVCPDLMQVTQQSK